MDADEGCSGCEEEEATGWMVYCGAGIPEAPEKEEEGSPGKDPDADPGPGPGPGAGVGSAEIIPTAARLRRWSGRVGSGWVGLGESNVCSSESRNGYRSALTTGGGTERKL